VRTSIFRIAAVETNDVRASELTVGRIACDNGVVAQPRPPKRPVAEDREVDFLICRNCQTPCYVFEMEAGRIQDAQCLVCGNDSPSEFTIGDEAGTEDAG
jgi:hypothetical protein